MGALSAGRVALLSIHPEYAQAILEGRKEVEFRRAAFAEPVRSVVIYSTSPVGLVIGRFDVRAIEAGSPTALWEKFRLVAGISRSRFRDYFYGASRGYAIRVGEVVAFDEPYSLQTLGRDLVPPQSFRYLSDEAVDQLRNLEPAA